MKRKCRICGCTDNHACHHPEFGNCWWEEKNLCSHCTMIDSGKIKKENVSYLWADDSCTNPCMSEQCQYKEICGNRVNHFEKGSRLNISSDSNPEKSY